MFSYIIRRGWLILPALLLAGCNMVVMSPSGDIAKQQSHLIIVSTLLMLLIIVPVIALTFLFAWRYRKKANAHYEPDWDHSTQLELIIWGAPLLIIIALGAITWISTHTLDPYRPLSRIDANRPIPVLTQTLNVEVVALDWKWLFIYPDLGIATVNEVAAPIDVPIRFKITSSTVMNSFYIPALAGQIYAMGGMQTEMNAVINKPGEYKGISANYSGEGFSGMHFKFHGMTPENFEQWVQKTKASNLKLDRADYIKLEKPSQKDPVRYYGKVDADLYHAILNRCVESGAVCMDHMMMTDKNVKPAKVESKTENDDKAAKADPKMEGHHE